MVTKLLLAILSNALFSNSLTLDVGKPHTVTSNNIQNIRLTKRGVVDAEMISPNSWSLLCLKEGVVIMETLLDTGEPGKRQVITCEKLSGRSKIYNTNTGDFKQWLIWRGECQEMKSCVFSSHLSPPGRRSLKKWLHQQISNTGYYELTPTNLKIFTQCPIQKSKQIFGASYECYKHRNTTYLVKLRIHLLASNQSSSRKLDLLKIEAKDINLFFERQKINENLRVLGSPEFYSSTLSPTIIESGGEFPQMSEDKIEWKSYGLKINQSLTPTMNFDQVISQTQIHLSMREGDSLKVNTFKNTLKLGTNTFTRIGTSQIDSRLKKNSHPFGLSGIPIISPLIKSERSHEGMLRLEYWVQIIPIKKGEP